MKSIKDGLNGLVWWMTAKRRTAGWSSAGGRIPRPSSSEVHEKRSTKDTDNFVTVGDGPQNTRI
jgi:hypothetical protein